ncbi:hypothetical protein [Saccharomonospora viridis]|jgi:hypothetical protein|uniref:Uncharacterized protein n=1 Tax=Saccharomonospora viridis TaxID=1852 RepID=A0A837DD40_9PSEU|nr:hypothetical protein [Saccharomonospora viridis]KHF45390.1 hypothetical protein MINT15_06070 [Saccharomonospora viridis]SFP77895.1 hypothetical protein SAMN02982918_3393 [Saccharomonospora viridis]
MSLPAGLFIILAVAASWAGWWLLAAVVLAGCLAWVARRSTPRGRVGELLAAVREWLLFVVSVTVPAAYLASAPTSVGTAEVAYLAVVAGVVLVAVAADALGANSSDRTSRWPVVLFGVAAAAFVAVCLAIPPAPQPITDSDPFSPFGLLVATTVVLPWLMGLDRVRLAVGTVAALAVGAAALYQLGPIRLGLSVTSLRDVLAAADAAALTSMLIAVAALAGLTSAVGCAGRLRQAGERLTGGGNTGRWSGAALVAVGGAAIWAAVLGPVSAVLLAGAVALTEVVHGLTGRRRRG